MAKKDESLLNLLVRLPWWISAIVAVLFFLILRFVVPLLSFQNPFLNGLAGLSPQIAPVLLFLFLSVSLVSAIASWRNSRMLDAQKGLATVKDLSWQEFETLVGEVFRRKGYFVLENPGAGPDGGVDLRLRKDGKKVYAQCKHWKTRQVGVRIVRELYGVMTDKNADEGIVVTYGTFTREARDFALGKPISLIGGRDLVGLIETVQKNPGAARPQPEKMICPKCGSEMVLRTARKGKYAGQKFWGCTNFPQCRTIVKAA